VTRLSHPAFACGVVADPGNRGATAPGGGAAIRRTLPQRRAAESFDLRFWNQPFTVNVGFYADGTPGEVFIEGCKTGNDIQSIARNAGVVLTALMHRLLADETLRQALVKSIIRNIAAGSIATVVHRRRGAE
jgi:hypothetical protein